MHGGRKYEYDKNIFSSDTMQCQLNYGISSPGRKSFVHASLRPWFNEKHSQRGVAFGFESALLPTFPCLVELRGVHDERDGF